MINKINIYNYIPWIFVWIWSTGFLAAKYGLPYAEPFILLTYRFGITLLVLLPIIIIQRRNWANSLSNLLHLLISGILIHGIYLGGVFQAIKWGMPAGLSSMIIGLQPIIMALIASSMLKEFISKKQWLGIVISLLGLYLVLSGHLANVTTLEISNASIVIVFVALFAVSLGVIYQKRFCSSMDLVTGTWVQYLGALVVCLTISMFFEAGKIQWEVPFIATLVWQVLGLSIGAILLLMVMIKNEASTRVGSYFYLVAPAVTVQAWFLFDEELTMVAMFGILLITLGVNMSISQKSNSHNKE
ncbi:MAG: DMT family transporter [PS1 clade bacterium]